jgi:hypothetical protein
MNKPKFIFSSASFFLVCLLSFTTSFAQTSIKQQSESSYEVVLQVLIASNTAADKSVPVPQTLSNVVKKLKTNYTFSIYRLTSTYFQRVANRGNIYSNSISNEPNQNQDIFSPVFSDLALNGLQNMPNANGQNSISIENFRFGQKVPIKTADFKDGSGKSNSVVNYEHVGLQMQKLNLSVNMPTIIGSLLTSKPDEMMFLVLTIKPVEE